ncbi:hypothetical protein TIFTF001_035117 [Ficus carica]|uniref:Ubiquitin-like protease family profile domain-containing protein n=1 Tax=Ficus carica TaxID=3494 RepID=A0AA88J9P3_FICCA|nr:hypothetical protein TIFTF001_035117 [Ficus carica]
MASAEKRPPAEKNPKKPAPKKKRRAPEEGLKRKQGEIEVKESKKAKKTLEEKKNANAEEYQRVIWQPCIKKFLKLETFGWAGKVLHNIVMRLTDHSGIGDALWFELSNAKFDNDDDAIKLGLLYMIFCITLVNANSMNIDPKYFAPADNLEKFNAFPWGMLSWEATRAPQCFVMMPTDKELNEPCVAQLYLMNPMFVPQVPCKTPIMQPSIATNSDWLEFQKEIRGEVEEPNHCVPYDGLLNSDIGVVADKGVKAAMEFLNADKEDEDEEGDKEKEVEKDKDDKGENDEEKDKEYEEQGEDRETKENDKKNYENGKGKEEEKKVETTKEKNEEEKDEEAKGEEEEINDEEAAMEQDKEERKNEEASKQQEENINDQVNTLLIPMHLEDLKHWVLAKLDLLNWTIEVYDSLNFEGPQNDKVRETLECISKFIPMLAERLSLFEFKPKNPLGTFPIPVTIMGDSSIFTFKNAEYLIDGRNIRYWVIEGCMKMFREWLTCYLWSHAKRKAEDNYKSDEEVDMMDF